MPNTAQLDIETTTGDGDTAVTIDPAFWAANQSTIQGYADAAGVKLYYQDRVDAAGSSFAPSSNVNTLADAKFAINQAASLREGNAKATDPAAPPAAAADDSGPLVLFGLVLLGGLVALAAAASSASSAYAPRVARTPRRGPSSVMGPEGSYLSMTAIGRGRWLVSYRGEAIGNVRERRDGSWEAEPWRSSSLGPQGSVDKLGQAAHYLAPRVAPS